MTNFVFGILIGLFIVAGLVIAGLIWLDWLYRESDGAGALVSLFV
jgi:hypothetical protein